MLQEVRDRQAKTWKWPQDSLGSKNQNHIVDQLELAAMDDSTATSLVLFNPTTNSRLQGFSQRIFIGLNRQGHFFCTCRSCCCSSKHGTPWWWGFLLCVRCCRPRIEQWMGESPCHGHSNTLLTVFWSASGVPLRLRIERPALTRYLSPAFHDTCSRVIIP